MVVVVEICWECCFGQAKAKTVNYFAFFVPLLYDDFRFFVLFCFEHPSTFAKIIQINMDFVYRM